MKSVPLMDQGERALARSNANTKSGPPESGLAAARSPFGIRRVSSASLRSNLRESLPSTAPQYPSLGQVSVSTVR
eukprot:c47378_g1_i1 orf=2-223(-)